METRFDAEKAQHAIDFFERLLVHTKGTWARKPFHLVPFQRHIIGSLFGWQMLDPDYDEWGRLYNLAWIELARGSGKSELLAGIALKLTGADDEEGAEVYGVAKDTDQASLVFNVAKRMLELSELGGGPRDDRPFVIYPTNKRIVYPKTSSFYRVIAADALGNLGQDPHGIVFDEIIAQPNGDLWDALKTGFKRLQPLMVAATTAGDDPESFARAEHDFSMRVMDNPELAPRRFVLITSVPKDAQIDDETVWKAATPALKHPKNPEGFLRPQTIRDEYHEAFVGTPDQPPNIRAQRAFKQFRMNQWLDTPSEAWVGLDDWDASGLPPEGARLVAEDDLLGRRAFGGLVAASVRDLTCLHWVFPPANGEDTWHAIWRFFLPEESFTDLVRRTRDWVDGGAEQWRPLIELTEGNEVDIARHVEAVEQDLERFDVQQIAHDAHGVLGIVQPIVAKYPELPVAISPNTQGTALLDWEQLIRRHLYRHGGHPIIRWEIAHTLVRETANGVVRIDRRNAVEEVSGVYAAELALRRALVTPEEGPRELVTTY